jgi:RND superfamily putative drug exporter
VVRHRLRVVAAWLAALIVAGIFAARLPGVVRGGADPIPSSETGAVIRRIESAFGRGSYYQMPVVVESGAFAAQDLRFASVVGDLAYALESIPAVRQVVTAWNRGAPELLGRDGQSALLLITPEVASFSEAEALTGVLRDTLRAHLPAGFRAHVTGTTAVLHDLDTRSSSDLLEAERIGIPLTLLILLAVFRAPLAALLPLALALLAITVSNAWLYLLSRAMPVSVFALNVVSMIGLGVGVDYALFVLSRFRTARRAGADATRAARTATAEAGEAVVFSAAAVAVGFLALLLVDAPFLRAIALGGTCVVVVAAAAAVTLLPAFMARLGDALEWPRRRSAPASAKPAGEGAWGRWARFVMDHPWPALLLAGAVLLALALPARQLQSWNVGAESLPAEMESRRGFESLRRSFSRGWMGPTVILFEAPVGRTVWEPPATQAILSTASRLEADPRVEEVLGFNGLAPALEMMEAPPRSRDDLPPMVRVAAGDVVSADGRFALLLLLNDSEPPTREAGDWVRALRRNGFPETANAGLTVRVAGPAAGFVDFDDELFQGLPRVFLAVLTLTFVVLFLVFRSILIPLKAIVLNLLSVLASYGFLVLVFQHGVGADLLRLDPPGGLNSFVVLMLFTILFGLSMDYEVFLLSRIRQAYDRLGDTRAAVATGLEQTAGVITSAALIMISIFAAFGFTRLVPTREFGLGLAFAVLLDATLVRVVLVPASMAPAGRLNWWLPRWLGGGRQATPTHRRAIDGGGEAG